MKRTFLSGLAWLKPRHAAELLDLTVGALHARIRRAPKHHDGLREIADLGGGVLAVRLQRAWRVYVPPPLVADGTVLGSEGGRES